MFYGSDNYSDAEGVPVPRDELHAAAGPLSIAALWMMANAECIRGELPCSDDARY